MQKKPLLSISILVSNRIDTIRNCMESIKPLLDGFPCELIAVDTVGEATDGSIEIVREYTDKIYRFVWCDDFAAARNFGLEKCTGEWFMFMDDDEWFEDVSEIVDFFKSGEYKKYNSATYQIRSYSNKEGAYSLASLFRMVKRTKDTKFVSRIHEYLQPLLSPAKAFTAYIHHYGYAFSTEEEKKAHFERNLRLLEPEFEKDPWNMHIRLQMIQEYMSMEEWKARAKELCEKTWEAEEKYYKTREFQWILLAGLRMANNENDYEKVVELAEMMRKRFPLSAIADLAMSIIEVNARCKLQQYEKGAAITLHALERRQYLLDNPEVRKHLNILDFETFLADNIHSELLKSGARCFKNIGNQEKAVELVQENFRHRKNPVLTISVLVSNRINTIRKCLDSIKPLCEAFPCELIVVDTVGAEQSDGSLEIAKEYTSHIVPFVWCDDFAAARNAGLQAAKGEWFLYLDDDEWFEDVEEIKDFFVNGDYMEYNSATYHVRNYADMSGNTYSDAVVGRMIRRNMNSAFEGCIDESFCSMYLPNKEFSSYVHHYGFVFADEQEKKNRMQYKYRLLRKGLEKYPENLRNRVQLAAVLSVENPNEAMKLCIETIEVCRDKKEQSQYQWQFVVLYGILENLQAQDTAKQQYLEWKEEGLMLPFAEQIVCYRLTRLCVLGGNYTEAYPHAMRYFALEEQITQNEIPAEFLKYQQGDIKEEMARLGAFCAWQAKAYPDAWSLYEKMPWETACENVEDSLWKVFAMAEEQAEPEVLFHIIKRVMINDKAKMVLGRMMQSNPKVKQRVNLTLEAQRTAGTEENTPLLSIGILVSNRKDTIRKCMESLQPLLKAIPSELIALDTVGEATDGSVDIVREYTDKVYRYEWCNDFADARNQCLSRASGEWFMYLDDDEWFEDISEITAFFQSGEYKKYNSATYQIRNYTDFTGKNYSVADLGRMIQREENIRFTGTVHEAFSEFKLPCKAFSAFVHHYGYAYASEEEKLAHIKRNIGLLQEEFEKNPTNLHIRTQMALELANFDNEAALAVCEETLQLCENEKHKPEFQWQLSLIFRLYEALGTECEKAEQKYKEIKERFGLTETAENAITYQLARIHLIGGNAEGALPHIRTFLKTERVLRENPDKAVLQMSGDFARYRTPESHQEMLKYGAFSAWQMKNYTESWTYFEEIAWETADAGIEEYMWKLFALAEENYNGDAIFGIVKRIMTNDVLKPVLGKLMQHPSIKQMVNDTLQMQRDKKTKDTSMESAHEAYAMAEKLLFSEQGTQVGHLFEEYVQAGHRYFSMLYQPDCFSEEKIKWLTPEVRFLDILYNFLQDGKTEYRMLIEAAKIRPELAKLIKCWLNELTGR